MQPHLVDIMFIVPIAVIIGVAFASDQDYEAQREADAARPYDESSSMTSIDSLTSTSIGVSEGASNTMLYSSTVTSTVTSPDTRSRRIKQKAKAIYGRGKSSVINRASYYIVDYALSLKAIAMLFGAENTQTTSLTATATQSTYQEYQQPQSSSQQPQPQQNTSLNGSDRALLTDAVRAFLKPLITFQAAQKNEDEEKLSSSIIGILDILLQKSSGDSDNRVDEGDWTPGQLWTSVVRREHVDKVLNARDNIFQAKSASYSDAVKNEDQSRLNKIRNYYQSLSPSSNKFAKIIHPRLDMGKFGARYIDVIEKVLLKKPDLVRKCRIYLAKYLQTGNSNEGYYQNLLKDAQAAPVGSDSHTVFATLLNYLPALIGLIVAIH